MATLRAKLLKKSKELLKLALDPLKEMQDLHSMNGWILERRKEISALEIKIAEAEAEEIFNPDDILDAMDTLALEKLRLAQGMALKKRMFEDEIEESEEN